MAEQRRADSRRVGSVRVGSGSSIFVFSVSSGRGSSIFRPGSSIFVLGLGSSTVVFCAIGMERFGRVSSIIVWGRGHPRHSRRWGQQPPRRLEHRELASDSVGCRATASAPAATAGAFLVVSRARVPRGSRCTSLGVRRQRRRWAQVVERLSRPVR